MWYENSLKKTKYDKINMFIVTGMF
jgi:hypothetical protein